MKPEFAAAAGVTIILSIGSIVNMATGVNSPIIINSQNTFGVYFSFHSISSFCIFKYVFNSYLRN